MLGAAGSGGAAGPVIHRLMPWTPLITYFEAVVGRFLGWFRPTRRLIGATDPLGGAGPPPCRVMHQLRSGAPRIASE
jgi:hypothetical protein